MITDADDTSTMLLTCRLPLVRLSAGTCRQLVPYLSNLQGLKWRQPPESRQQKASSA